MKEPRGARPDARASTGLSRGRVVTLLVQCPSHLQLLV